MSVVVILIPLNNAVVFGIDVVAVLIAVLLEFHFVDLTAVIIVTSFLSGPALPAVVLACI